MTYPGGYCPYDHAEQLGITIEYMDTGEHYGLWIPDIHTIYLKPGMRHVHEICVLTHEIGHALFGHREGTPKNERQANSYMANKLIDAERLKRVQAESSDPNVWAHELQVTLQTLEIFIEESKIERSWHAQHTAKARSIKMATTGKPLSLLTVNEK